MFDELKKVNYFKKEEEEEEEKKNRFRSLTM